MTYATTILRIIPSEISQSQKDKYLYEAPRVITFKHTKLGWQEAGAGEWWDWEVFVSKTQSFIFAR